MRHNPQTCTHLIEFGDLKSCQHDAALYANILRYMDMESRDGRHPGLAAVSEMRTSNSSVAPSRRSRNQRRRAR